MVQWLRQRILEEGCVYLNPRSALNQLFVTLDNFHYYFSVLSFSNCKMDIVIVHTSYG